MENKTQTRIEYEEIELLTIKKQNGTTRVDITPDTDRYQILGILKTYTKALEEELTDEWRPETDEEEH